MGGNLRAGPKAGRQRTLVMRAVRVASATVLSLVALLMWRATEPSVPHARHVDLSTALSNAVATRVGVVALAEQRLSNDAAAQSSRVDGRHQLLARSRATGDGDAPQTAALVAWPTAPFGDVAGSARARIRRLALGHAPYDETSPFDATAPPASSLRNG